VRASLFAKPGELAEGLEAEGAATRFLLSIAEKCVVDEIQLGSLYAARNEALDKLGLGKPTRQATVAPSCTAAMSVATPTPVESGEGSAAGQVEGEGEKVAKKRPASSTALAQKTRAGAVAGTAAEDAEVDRGEACGRCEVDLARFLAGPPDFADF